MKIGLILMASGAGSRFGGNKLFADVGGRPLVDRAMDAYPPALFSRATVVSCYPALLTLAEAKGYHTKLNQWSDEGISASIRLGMEEMAGTDGVVFAVCDQPWLTVQSVQRLLAAFEAQPDQIAALSWGGRRGNPCLFPPAFYRELSTLTGDRGGGAVIRAHPEALLLVTAADPRELRDVDTPGDLEEHTTSTF